MVDDYDHQFIASSNKYIFFLQIPWMIDTTLMAFYWQWVISDSDRECVLMTCHVPLFPERRFYAPPPACPNHISPC